LTVNVDEHGNYLGGSASFQHTQTWSDYAFEDSTGQKWTLNGAPWEEVGTLPNYLRIRRESGACGRIGPRELASYDCRFPIGRRLTAFGSRCAPSCSYTVLKARFAQESSFSRPLIGPGAAPGAMFDRAAQ
jgi:hypothetical protein